MDLASLCGIYSASETDEIVATPYNTLATRSTDLSCSNNPPVCIGGDFIPKGIFQSTNLGYKRIRSFARGITIRNYREFEDFTNFGASDTLDFRYLSCTSINNSCNENYRLLALKQSIVYYYRLYRHDDSGNMYACLDVQKSSIDNLISYNTSVTNTDLSTGCNGQPWMQFSFDSKKRPKSQVKQIYKSPQTVTTTFAFTATMQWKDSAAGQLQNTTMRYLAAQTLENMRNNMGATAERIVYNLNNLLIQRSGRYNMISADEIAAGGRRLSDTDCNAESESGCIDMVSSPPSTPPPSTPPPPFYDECYEACSTHSDTCVTDSCYAYWHNVTDPCYRISTHVIFTRL